MIQPRPLADEWLVVPAFWQRWYFSENGRAPSHRAFNEQQWGAMLAAGQDGHARRRAGAHFFEAAFGIADTRVHPKGVYAGLVHLGCDARTERAWQASQHRVLERLEAHFAIHDFVLGGRPSLLFSLRTFGFFLFAVLDDAPDLLLQILLIHLAEGL